MDAVLEKIEDWEDMQAVKDFEQRKASGETIKRYTMQEIISEHGIDL
jgi:hypothetical protein